MRRKIHYVGLSARQRGLSLIELMIGVVLALFLVGGVAVIEQSMRGAYGDQASLNQLQDNERLAMTLMNDVIQAAGYFPNPTSNTAASVFPASGSFSQQQQVITGTTGASPPGDTISVRYSTDGTEGLLDCTGSTVTAPGNLTYTFAITSGALTCSVNGGTAIPLVTGVTNMTVLYGVKTGTGNSTPSIDTYLSANQMTTSNWWTTVRSVRVSITFTNPLANQAHQPATMQISRVINLNSQTS